MIQEEPCGMNILFLSKNIVISVYLNKKTNVNVNNIPIYKLYNNIPVNQGDFQLRSQNNYLSTKI